MEEDENRESQEVRNKFSHFLYDYISRNALKHSLLAKMTAILVSHTPNHTPYYFAPFTGLHLGRA